MAPSPTLCEKCKNVFDHWGELCTDEHLVKLQHHEHVFALKASADHGCPICGQFFRNLSSRGEVDKLMSSTIDVLNAGNTPIHGSIQIISFKRIVSNGGPDLYDRWLLELIFRVVGNSRLEDISDNEEDTISSDSDNSSWADAVFYNEYRCKAIMLPANTQEQLLSAPNLAPLGDPNPGSERLDFATTHLLQSWFQDCRQNHLECSRTTSSVMPTRLLRVTNRELYLVHSINLAHGPEYAALSHCWGTLSILKLTSNNIRALENGMDLNILCKTFQDAAHVTQLLGLEYLWVDSLCIIQDDLQDWDTESRKMGAIYSSSAINIAATSAKDGSKGLFFPKDPSHVPNYRVRARLRYDVSVQYDCVEDGIANVCRNRTPLARRAWVLQERLLSPRTIHFSSTQIFWECNSLTACEAFPKRFPSILTWGDFYFPKQRLTINLWPQIVQIYSGCQLTYSTDKLIAISGLARHIQSQALEGNRASSYCAGLWSTNMEYQLCWKSREPSKRPTTAQAPSWSWAAVSGIVGLPTKAAFDLTFLTVDIEILSTDFLSSDPYGAVPKSILVILCNYLAQATLMFTEGSSFIAVTRWGPIPSTIDLDYDDISDETAVYLLPVIGHQRGLVLVPAKHNDEPILKRIGHMQLHIEDGVKFRDHFKLSTLRDGVEYYNGTTQYTFKLG